MAKFGEGDARWIVQDRADGTNVNNWHWKESDVLKWSHKRFDELFGAMVLVEDGGLKAQCSGVDSLTGDCIINTRKGKHIPSYELALTLKWKGEKEGAHLEGKISFPYIAEENHDEDPEFTVSVSGVSEHEAEAKQKITRGGRDKLLAAVRTWVDEIHRAVPLSHQSGAAGQKESDRAESKGANGASGSREKAAKKEADAKKKKEFEAEGFGTIRMVEKFICRPGDVYEALMDPRRVMAFTQSPCNIEARVGGKVMMFGGTVEAEITALEPGKKIGQKWRRAEWPEGCWSELTMELEEPERGNTVLTLEQRRVPDTDRFGNGGVVESIESGWRERVFGMMRKVFGYGHNMFA